MIVRTITLKGGKTGNGEDMAYDLDKLAEIDLEQNRLTLTGTELDGMITLIVARCCLSDGLHDAERFVKDAGELRAIRACESMLSNAISRLGCRMSGVQNISLANNVHKINIMLTAENERNPHRQQIVLNREAAHALVNQASKACGLTCSCTYQQSKTCPVRNAIETVPGAKGQARSLPYDALHCPYQMFEMED